MGVWKLIENEEERNAIGKEKISVSLIRIYLLNYIHFLRNNTQKLFVRFSIRILTRLASK